MKLTEQLLARRYAQAYYAVYKDKLTPAAMQQLEEFYAWYIMHEQHFFYLGLAHIPAAVKADAFVRTCAPFGIRVLLERLIDLLAEQGRLVLVGLVLQELIRIYQHVQRHVAVTVYSSHELAPDVCEKIQQFLERMTKKHVHITYVQDPELIAGIRVQSDTFLWEHSVAQQLRAFSSYSKR